MPKRMSLDDQQLSVLDALVTLHSRRNPTRHWFTVNEISETAHVAVATGKNILFSLAADGWLNMRDADTGRENILISLRKEYQK